MLISGLVLTFVRSGTLGNTYSNVVSKKELKRHYFSVSLLEFQAKLSFIIFRGFPVWLKYIPGINFRTENGPFKVSHF